MCSPAGHRAYADTNRVQQIQGCELFKTHQIRLEGANREPRPLIDLVRRIASVVNKMFTKDVCPAYAPSCHGLIGNALQVNERYTGGIIRREATVLLGCVNVSKGTWQIILADMSQAASASSSV
jgi:hypothetical protein